MFLARMFGQKPATVETITKAEHVAIVAAHRQEIETLRSACFAAERDLQTARHEARANGAALSEVLNERDAAHATLRIIANMVTPGSAPIGKRMAATAKAGLPEYLVEQAA